MLTAGSSTAATLLLGREPVILPADVKPTSVVVAAVVVVVVVTEVSVILNWICAPWLLLLLFLSALLFKHKTSVGNHWQQQNRLNSHSITYHRRFCCCLARYVSRFYISPLLDMIILSVRTLLNVQNLICCFKHLQFWIFVSA